MEFLWRNIKVQKNSDKNKTKVSVALEYTPGEEAPKIIASGKRCFSRKNY